MDERIKGGIEIGEILTAAVIGLGFSIFWAAARKAHRLVWPSDDDKTMASYGLTQEQMDDVRR